MTKLMILLGLVNSDSGLFERVNQHLRPSYSGTHYANAFSDNRTWKDFEEFRKAHASDCLVTWSGITMSASCHWVSPRRGIEQRRQ